MNIHSTKRYNRLLTPFCSTYKMNTFAEEGLWVTGSQPSSLMKQLSIKFFLPVTIFIIPDVLVTNLITKLY